MFAQLPFLMFLLRPGPIVADRLMQSVEISGLGPALGDRLFDRTNLHQSVSDRHPDTPEKLSLMRRVGDTLVANAFDLSLDRIVSRCGERIDLRFEPSDGKTPPFLAFLTAMRGAFAQVPGVDDPVLHAPHLTFCYGAPAPLKTLRFPPIQCSFDRLELVRRMHHPYRYDTLAAWPLLPATASTMSQSALF
jgi:hypothetical protein